MRVALINLSQDGRGGKAFSMLIHTAGKTNDHIVDKRVVELVLSEITTVSLGIPDAEAKIVIEKLIETCNKINLGDSPPPIQDIVEFVLQNIGKNEVLGINHTEDKSNVLRACKPKSYFTFAIGGNIVSRGLTFDNLLSFFFSRNVKGKLQQNTYIQRARMFGNRPYSKFFELAAPESLFENWADLFQDHELSLRFARGGHYVHIQSKTNSAADSASVDKTNVEEISTGENPVGSIFNLSPLAEEELCKQTDNTIVFLEKLIADGLIPKDAFPNELLQYIKEVTSSDGRACVLVRKHHADNKVTLQSISEYSDGDETTIRRKRGGIIDAIIHKRAIYANALVYILPIKNAAGQARFLFKTKLGKKILKNTLNR